MFMAAFLDRFLPSMCLTDQDPPLRKKKTDQDRLTKSLVKIKLWKL